MINFRKNFSKFLMLTNQLAPIALFVYNRPGHTASTVNSLLHNEEAKESALYIFADAAKSVSDSLKTNEVRDFIKSITGMKEINIIYREKNFGLAKSIIEGVSYVLEKHARVIVLEDDLLLSNYFLKYMNEALDLYEKVEKVVSVHGYCYPVKGKLPETYFLRGADCWGWATWKDRWNSFEQNADVLHEKIVTEKLEYEFDFNGKLNNLRMLKRQIAGEVDSWAIRWHASAFLQNKFTLYPGRSLVDNIGTDGGGTHTKATRVYSTSIAREPINIGYKEPSEEDEVKEIIEKYFVGIRPNFLNRWKKELVNFIRKRLN